MLKNNKLILAGVGLLAGATIAFSPAVQATSSEKYTVTYPYYGFVQDPDNPWESVYDALDETGTVEYSDDFFSVASPGDHPELRAMSYALALAGYENLSSGYPMESEVANPKLWDLFNQLGLHDYATWDVSSEIDGHSMGTSIARKTLSSGETLVVVAPRNYNYMTEWLSNINVGKTGDHAGFAEAANLLKSRLSQYITSRGLENYKLWIVGYSRGGAVVDLAARDINAHLSDYKISADNLYAYTFGAPRGSDEETKYSNIHDVKDGNDLILGYLFPAEWGFYNTGVYEEIHPADLKVTTAMVDIADLVDSSKAMEAITSDNNLTKDVAEENGKDFMDSWLAFVTENGLTRDYFDEKVKPPLSALLQDYQLRTLDRQDEYIDFVKDTKNGIAGRVAGNVFADLLMGGYGTSLEEALDNFPPYQILVRILKGTATDADIDELGDYLTQYIGDYDDYRNADGEPPVVTMAEFEVMKVNLPKLIKSLAPLIVADAKYTQDTYGEKYSLYYTYSLVTNFQSLLYGHIPESVMPILKSLIVEDEGEEDSKDESEETVIVDDTTSVPSVPNTGDKTSKQENTIMVMGLPAAAVAGSAIALVTLFTAKKRHNK